jgi:hypothetical protein
MVDDKFVKFAVAMLELSQGSTDHLGRLIQAYGDLRASQAKIEQGKQNLNILASLGHTYDTLLTNNEALLSQLTEGVKKLEEAFKPVPLPY